ncbi:hypothetical protein ACQ86N_08930 [Puia sp. P3]|uniref:hypothetical protein n=1 Tax=Puia sp. P3 TaxID=3423952 RepID=UPI003D66880C
MTTSGAGLHFKATKTLHTAAGSQLLDIEFQLKKVAYLPSTALPARAKQRYFASSRV